MSTKELLEIVYGHIKKQAKYKNAHNYGVLGILPKVVQ